MADDERSLRVLLISLNYEPEAAGIAPYASGLARGLQAHGHDVRVLTGYPHYPQWKVRAGYTGLGMTERLGGASVVRRRHYVPRRPSTINRLLMEITFGLRVVTSRWARPDVVILVSPALVASWIAAIRARLEGVPVITWVQDIYTLGIAQTGGGGGSTRVVRGLEQRLLQRSARVVVIHDRFRSYLSVTMGVTSPIDVIRNWSHVEASSTADTSRVRRLHGWGKDEVIVLHAGNMGVKQGLENVVAASRVAADRNAAIRFVLMGDGRRRRKLQDLDPNPNLQFLEPQPDGLFEETLAAADVLLVNEIPGLTEMSVPSKLTTYWATGRPVVAAVDRRSTTAEEIRVSKAGVVVEPAAPVALVNAVEALARDADLCRTLGAAGREFRRRHLSEQAGIEAFDGVLHQTVRGMRADVGSGEDDR